MEMGVMERADQRGNILTENGAKWDTNIEMIHHLKAFF